MLLHRILVRRVRRATAGCRGWSPRSCTVCPRRSPEPEKNPDYYFAQQSWVGVWFQGWRPGPWAPPRSLRSPVAMAEIETSGYTGQPRASPFPANTLQMPGSGGFRGKRNKESWIPLGSNGGTRQDGNPRASEPTTAKPTGASSDAWTSYPRSSPKSALSKRLTSFCESSTLEGTSPLWLAASHLNLP